MLLKNTSASLLFAALVLSSPSAFSNAVKPSKWKYSGHQPVVTAETPINTPAETAVALVPEQPWSEWAQENAYALGLTGLSLAGAAYVFAIKFRPKTPYENAALKSSLIRHYDQDECRKFAKIANKHLGIKSWMTTGKDKLQAFAGALKQAAGGALPSMFGPGEAYTADEFAEDWNALENDIHQNYQDLVQDGAILPDGGGP